MGFISVLTILVFLGTSESTITAVVQNNFKIIQAIKNISEMFFVESFTNIAIIDSLSDDMKIKTNDILTDLIVEMGSDFRIVIEDPAYLKNSFTKKISPMIILINNMESFEKMKDKLSYNPVRFRKFYILVLVDGMFTGIESIVKQFWNQWIHNLNVLSEDVDGTITMRTFFPFSNGKCGNEETISIINSFDSVTCSWSSDVFFPQKFNNLHLCPLSVIAIGSNAPSVVVKKSKKGKDEFSGFEVDIIKEFAQIINSSINFINYEDVREVYENRSNANETSGIFRTIFTKSCDLILGSLSLQYDRTLQFTESKSFFSVPMAIVIPPAAEMSALKKLIRPLSELVWVLLLAVFIIGIMFITFLKTTSLKAYRFVVGKDVKYPILNMLIALVGNTQAKLPKLNFTRFLLMKFLLFCLVIRSVYQGRLYNILQSNLHEKELATIDDIIENNMIFFAYESMKNRIQGFKFSTRFEITLNF